MDIFLQPENLLSLLTLTLMEIVLGIDNVVFLSILTGKLPASQQESGRRVGLGLALVFRILLLCAISEIVKLVTPLVSVFEFNLSGRDLILLGGGLFLMAKSTMEIHAKLEGEVETGGVSQKKVSFASVIVQIILLDMVFSLDSVITAVGLVKHLSIMITAVVLSLVVMLVFSRATAILFTNIPQ